MHAEHRRRYLDALGESAAVVAGGRRGSIEREASVCPSSDLYWLTGWDETDAVAVFRPGAARPFVLFVPERSPARERIDGPGPGVDEAVKRHGADEAWPLDELDVRLGPLLQGYAELHYAWGVDATRDSRVFAAIRREAGVGERNGMPAPWRLVDGRRLSAALRAVKSPAELEVLRAAATITVAGHRAGLRECRAGTYEYAVEASIDATFRRLGAAGPAYPTIVATGAHATIPHHSRNDGVLGPNELCLVDAGCRLRHYATDVTRTWPVGGRFTRRQRELYGVVLRAWKAAVAAVRPGASFADIDDAARRVLVDGVGVEGLPEHGFAHWLGLDVHDPSPYHDGGAPVVLRKGQVLAIEPALCLGEVGIRIEDDVVVTGDGAEVLSAGLPREIDEVEAAMC